MSVLPLAAVMPVLLKSDLLWMAGQFGMTVPKSKKKETVAQMVAEYLLTHPKEASLKKRIDKDWINAVTEEEGEELYNRIVGYPLEIYNMMHEEDREEEAVANLFFLLEKMGNLYQSNPDLFENKTDSLVPKMQLMMWWLTELYLIVKGNPVVNDDIKSDMDFFLTDLQRRTKLFNEASSKWGDMFVDNQPYAEDDGLWKHYKEDMKKRNGER